MPILVLSGGGRVLSFDSVPLKTSEYFINQLHKCCCRLHPNLNNKNRMEPLRTEIC